MYQVMLCTCAFQTSQPKKNKIILPPCTPKRMPGNENPGNTQSLQTFARPSGLFSVFVWLRPENLFSVGAPRYPFMSQFGYICQPMFFTLES